MEKEPALRWCRHVFDNPSPEMEAARRVLMKKLDQSEKAARVHQIEQNLKYMCGHRFTLMPLLLLSGLRYDFYRPAADSRHPLRVSSGNKTPVSTSLSDPESLGNGICKALLELLFIS